MKRFENFKVNGKDTGYRYMGVLENCETLGAFHSKDDCGTSYRRTILDDSPYYEFGEKDYLDTPIEHCSKIECKHFDKCELKGKDFDTLSECPMDEFPLDLGVVQYVVYYNEKLNSAIVFEVHGDYCEDNYGFDNISDIINDIYFSNNSTYRFFRADFSFEVAMETKNNIILTSYSNENEDMEWVNLNYASLEGKRVLGIMDILNTLKCI